MELEFLRNGSLPDLQFYPKRYTSEELDERHRALERLAGEIQMSEERELIRHVYLEKIEELRAMNRLVYAALTKQWNEFNQANETVYGLYDKNLQEMAGAFINTRIHSIATPPAKLQAHFSKWDHGQDLREILPSTELFEFAQAEFKASRLATMVPHDLQERFTLAEATRYIQDILATLAPEYTVRRVRANVMHFKVSHARKTLFVYGKDDIMMHRSRFIGLILGHEIGVHIGRRHNGSMNKVGLFISGGAQSNITEEGLGVIMEQLQLNSFDRVMQTRRFANIVCRYYAVGLALDGHDFQETYMLYKDLYELFNKEDKEVAAHHFAWHLTESVYRGTDGSNAAFMRPAIYLQKMVQSWQALAKNPNIPKLIPIGKFNILSPEQMALAKAIAKDEQIF